MTQDDKDLLLKDLCARLPYGVRAYYSDYCSDYEIESIKIVSYGDYKTCRIHLDLIDSTKIVDIDEIKPYLFPLSSMTKEQKEEFNARSLELQLKVIDEEIMYEELIEFQVDFFNKHHLDWRGLIPMGLAIDASGKNIY